MQVKVTDAELAHWVGFDKDGSSYSTEQAAADSLMLRLDLDVSTPANEVSCFIAAGDELHLVVDGERRGDVPEFYELSNVDAGTTAKQFVVYEIPADADVELEWGNIGGTTVLTEIPLS